MTDYDRWLTCPPDEPECEKCGEKQQRINDLESCLEWVAKHLGRITYVSAPKGSSRVVFLPWDASTPIEAPTQREALEKLWREHE